MGSSQPVSSIPPTARSRRNMGPICRRCRLSCGVHRQFRGGRVGAWRDESKSRPNSKHTDVPLNIGVISRKFSRTFCLLELHRHTEMPDLGRHIGIYELRQTPPGITESASSLSASRHNQTQLASSEGYEQSAGYRCQGIV